MMNAARVVHTFFVILIWLLADVCCAQAKFKEYTYLGGVFNDYEIEVIKLALSRTVEEYGDYVLSSGPAMTDARGLRSLLDAGFPNGLRVSTISRDHFKTQNIRYIPFPIYLGILGYRICYMNDESKSKLMDAETEEDIKKLVHGQGQYWRDVDILRENGYLVAEGHRTPNLYKMLSVKRIDLFCRGTNEIESEVVFAENYSNIFLDYSIGFFYPLPFFIYVDALNKPTFDRIQKGLLSAYEDGSIQALWEKHFGEGVRSAKLNHRKIFTLTNSHLQGVDTSFTEYFYEP